MDDISGSKRPEPSHGASPRPATVQLLGSAAGMVVVLVGGAVGLRVFDRLLPGGSGSPGTPFEAMATLLLAASVVATLLARRRHRELLSVREELAELALHDPLTGLPNRRRLRAWLTEDIEWSRHRNAHAGVMFIDLDRLKHVNDAFGHEVGDRLLEAVADRLRGLLGTRDRVVRLGGDEFVLLCPGVTGTTAIEKSARRIIRTLEQPFTIDDHTMRISASVGASLAERQGAKTEDVLRDADVAMYQAKARGAGNVVVFDRSMTGALTPATAERQIRDALLADEFQLHYQPVVDLATGRIVGAEALLRWVSASRGTMAPGEFVPILEETGLIIPVGTWVLQEACREAARLQELLPDQPPLTITVNVSARQLTHTGFAELVAQALHRSGIGEGQIHLEITEGALMHDVATAWAVLRQTKALGVKLALDDFGTGYSSLSYVRRFSLDMLKIDKSFIDGIDTSPEDRAIVEHVIGMAHALGMTTVAEGAERPEQLAWLQRLGCRLAQGFALSRPLSADDLAALLIRRQDHPFRIEAVPSRPVELAMPDPADLAPRPHPTTLAEATAAAPGPATSTSHDPPTPGSSPLFFLDPQAVRPGRRGSGPSSTPALAGATSIPPVTWIDSTPSLPRFREFQPDPDPDGPPA